jgi:outer membrane receptor for ferrienterochelin and colicin
VDNAIQYLANNTVLQDEAGCLTGLQPEGSSGLAPYTAHIPGSAYCEMVEKMVQRNAAGDIVSVESGPINEQSLYVSGIDASLDYKKHTDYGNFRTSINYTDNLSYKERVLASDPLLNTRYEHVASKATWIGDWTKGDWNVSVSGERDGSLRAPSYGACEVLENGIQPNLGDPNCVVYKGMVPIWITWNTAVSWQLNKQVKMTFTVSNIFNKVSAIPYYAGGFEFATTAQNATPYNGREMFLSFDWKID